MKPVPFAVGMVFVGAGVGSILIAGNGLAAVAFACAAIALYVLGGRDEGAGRIEAGPRRRIDPLEHAGEDQMPADAEFANLRFSKRGRSDVGNASLPLDPGLRIALVVAAVAVTLACLAYAARSIAEQRAETQAVELVQGMASELERAGQAAEQDLQRARADHAARQRAQAQLRERERPYYPPPSQVATGERACLNGTAVRREANGWSEVVAPSGLPQRCREHR